MRRTRPVLTADCQFRVRTKKKFEAVAKSVRVVRGEFRDFFQGLSPSEWDLLLKVILREKDSLEVMMKMVKSLVLGTAVAFAATVGAQAADMPVKAKPVSYVKICPQYGPGFYYIPGTDICLKVGGLLLAEVGYNARGAITFNAYSNAAGATGFDGTTNYVNWRSRAYYTLDSRQNTAYGTLRTFFFGGFEFTNGQNAVIGNNAPNYAFIQFAFLQFAGFTAGYATSFFDFAPNYLVLSVQSQPWAWNNLFAYTANFGNGLSATISIEDPTEQRSQLIGSAYGGHEAPNIIGNIRVDQAWGSAQLAGALTPIRSTNLGVDEEWGWAVSFGIEIKLPMLGAGDSIKFQASTSEGALDFTGLGGTPNGAVGGIGYVGLGQPGVLAFGDAQLVAGTLLLSEASSMSLQLRHFWTPALRSAFHVGWNEAYGFGAVGGNRSVQTHQIGHSLVWSPVAGLNLSLDVIYTEADVNNVTSEIVSTWFRVARPF